VKLPSPIQAYFDADKGGKSDALVQTFASDAVVQDEGRSYAGTQAIEAWWREVKAKYQHTVEPLESGERGDVTNVRARVTGCFPGSPAVLTFTFQINNDWIGRLEIGA
jgi:ketosteroid isomerase-like protein